ncbi:thioesterase domain [Seminavis robusta]|uniref:Thioesterase domain n=1 Tax=Seminavis robusta TaxID=568900 RepID=A0A9N8DES6_9STRA|nr:thioesterase domain [Seminavis robusta]|eukprot:Sro106_g053550.1 thioesterase domain (227) ;mRNA; r:60457-61137
MVTATSSASTTTTSLLIFLGVAAVTSFLAIASEAKKQESKTLHRGVGRKLSEVEKYVSTSIHVNMPPARRMGITVDQVILRSDEQEGFVSLSMPIRGNTNVHGSAFAGSLYSVCVLSAWYTLVIHLRDTWDEELLNQCTVVVQSAEINYKRPVWNTDDNEFIIATSFLPTKDDAWKAFVKNLEETRKTTCNISGEIKIVGRKPATTVKAVEFKALLCVMLPKLPGE